VSPTTRSYIKKFDIYLPPAAVYVIGALLAIAVLIGQAVWFVGADETVRSLHNHIENRCSSQTTADCLNYVSVAELCIWMLSAFWLLALMAWILLGIAALCYQRNSRDQRDVNDLFKSISWMLVILVVLTIIAGLIYITGLFIPDPPSTSNLLA